MELGVYILCAIIFINQGFIKAKLNKIIDMMEGE